MEQSINQNNSPNFRSSKGGLSVSSQLNRFPTFIYREALERIDLSSVRVSGGCE